MILFDFNAYFQAQIVFTLLAKQINFKESQNPSKPI